MKTVRKGEKEGVSEIENGPSSFVALIAGYLVHHPNERHFNQGGRNLIRSPLSTSVPLACLKGRENIPLKCLMNTVRNGEKEGVSEIEKPPYPYSSVHVSPVCSCPASGVESVLKRA